MIEEARRNEIVWLLTHRNDDLPVSLRPATPAAQAGFVGGRDEKGKPVRWVSCPDCIANDRVMPGCETCRGRGEIPDVGPDPYQKNEQVLPFGFEQTRHDASHERDRKIEMLARQTRPPRSEAELLEEANRRGYAWEETRRQMYARYDFAAIDDALDTLRAHDVDAAHAINAVYVDGWLAEVGQVTPLAEELCERGISFLSDRLPEEVRTGLAPKHPALVRRDRKHQRAA